jgi:hypothetical protein
MGSIESDRPEERSASENKAMAAAGRASVASGRRMRARACLAAIAVGGGLMASTVSGHAEPNAADAAGASAAASSSHSRLVDSPGGLVRITTVVGPAASTPEGALRLASASDPAARLAAGATQSSGASWTYRYVQVGECSFLWGCGGWSQNISGVYAYNGSSAWYQYGLHCWGSHGWQILNMSITWCGVTNNGAQGGPMQLGSNWVTVTPRVGFPPTATENYYLRVNLYANGGYNVWFWYY